ncbi:unnamed protein product [Paramecium primaurelia]|uniref:Uncharacterized protein n=1 Tax=Paramecium primaurelia TaxID=5886 RepID=A0A8S1LEM8_PARPR|nr:unnamed protein product [Paramecium primaurelia]
MSQKDKKSVKSDKSKEKKKKSTKLDKKDSKILPPPTDNDQQQLIAKIISRIGDKESKSLANCDDDDDYPQIQKYNNNNNYQTNDFVIQNNRCENYPTVNKNNNQLRTNKFMIDQTIYQQQQQQDHYNQKNQQQYQDQYYSLNQTQTQYQNQQFTQQATFDYRYERIKDQVSQSLIPKRQEILEQVQKIDNRIDEIKYQSQKIENITREECEIIIDKLKSVETQKLQMLYHDKNELLRDIDQIEIFQQRISYLQDFNSQKNLHIFENIERLSKKRIKKQIDIYPDDLPQDLIQLKQLQLQNQVLQKLMDLKNEIIWKLFSDSQIENKKIKEELEKQANQEFQEWYNIVDQYQQELNRYKLQCTFCGINFDYQLINTDCNSNQQDAIIQFDCEQIPPEQFFGTQRHFFCKSIQNQQSQIQIENNKV